MDSRRKYALLFALVAATVTLALVVGRSRRGHENEASVLSAVPRDAWLVAVVDVATLRESPLAKAALDATGHGVGGGTAIPGLGPLVDVCGFDPIVRLRELVVTAPEGGERGDFGVAFSADVSKDELATCADKAIRGRGGRPSTSTRGSFSRIEDAGSADHARVAYREGGPYLVGRGAWLDAMIDAVDGKGERARAEHAALRSALAAAAAGGAPRTLFVTALLPKALRDKLKADLAAEGGGIARPDPEGAFAAVLAVEQAGVSLRAGEAGGTTDVTAELHCESPADCDGVKRLVERKRLALSRDFGARMLGVGPLVDSLSVDVRGASLSAKAQAPTSELASVVKRAVDLDLLGLPRPSAPSRPPPSTSPPASP